MTKIQSVNFNKTGKSFDVVITDSVLDTEPFGLADVLESVVARTGMLFNNFKSETSFNKPLTAGKYTITFDSVVLSGTMSWDVKEPLKVNIGESHVLLAIDSHDGCLYIKHVEMPSCCTYSSAFKDAICTQLLKEINARISHYVNSEIVDQGIYFDAPPSLLATAMHLDRAIYNGDDKYAVRFTTSTDLCPILANGKAIIAVSNKALTEEYRGSIDYRARIDINGKAYEGRLVTVCEHTTYLVIFNYEPVKGYSMATDNMFSALFFAANIKSMFLTPDLRMVPVHQQAMAHVL